MDEVHIISGQDENHERKPSQTGKVIGIGLLSLFLLSAIGGSAYYFGRQSVKGTSTETESLTNTVDQYSSTNKDEASPPPTDSAVAAAISQSPTETAKTSPNPSSFTKTALLKSIPALDGYAKSAGEPSSTSEIKLGRDVSAVYRGFITFDLSSLPAGVQVGKAFFRLYQTQIKGSPFSNLGNIKVDHLNYGDSLDSTDYSLAALSSGFATIPQSTTAGWKEVDVTAKVKDDLASARSTSQFRIHFTIEKTFESNEDFVYFESAENTHKTGNTPQLVVTY